MTASLHASTVQASRAVLLEAIGDPYDLTLVRTPGNLGDALIAAGTAELLADHVYREVDLEGLCSAEGDTVVLQGSGAFCRPYHEVMPRALAVAELRFRRVIVLPSSFDTAEETVRDALARSRAIVFARERVSASKLVSLCDVRLAHDCAFFFDLARWRRDGSGTLNAFRTDPEATGLRALAPDNEDISATAPDLEAWLNRIAEHDLIRTDRAHVMIAAALMGKRVEFLPSAYHKLPAIAEFALSDYPVTQIERSAATMRVVERPRVRPASNGTRRRVSALILTRDRSRQALRAVDSLSDNTVGFDVLVLDQNSEPEHAERLAAGCAGLDHITVRRLDRNLGCAGGRRLGPPATTGEFVLFLDDDAELAPGALDILVGELDGHPEAQAVSATVVSADGTVYHSGGYLAVSGGVAEFSSVAGARAQSDPLPPSGPAGWVPGTAALIRRDALERCPVDDRMSAYFEDNEWSFRVAERWPQPFRRSAEARAIHSSQKRWPAAGFAARSLAGDWLGAHARFYARHRLLLGPSLFGIVPELVDERGERDIASARLLMELVLARGTDWVTMEWINGGLASLLGGRAEVVAHQRMLRDLRAELAESARVSQMAQQRERDAVSAAAEQAELLSFLHDRHLTLQRVENGGWWRLRHWVRPVLALASWAGRR